MRSDLQNLSATVYGAWQQIVGDPFDPDTRWEDTGADSLQCMRLILALEEALARKLSFDIIGPHTSAADLVRSLQNDVAPSTISTAPMVFLLPGLGGDDPALADFRRSFKGRVRFELIGYPGIDHPAAAALDMASIGAFAADAIERLSPSGAIVVAGYSFGGSVAFETAHRLIDRGRTVALLGVFDPVMSPPGSAPRRLTRKQKLMALAARLDFGRQLALEVIRRLRPGKLSRAKQFMVSDLKRSALRRWRPQPLGIPIFYVNCEQTPTWVEAKLRELGPDIRAPLRLPGGHTDLFNAAALAKLTPAFEAAVNAAAVPA